MSQRLILCLALILATSVHAKPEKPRKQDGMVHQLVGTYVGADESSGGECSVRIDYDKSTRLLGADATISGLSENEEYLWNSRMEFTTTYSEDYFHAALDRGWLELKEMWPHVQSINFHFDQESHALTHFVLIQRRSMLPSKVTRCMGLEKVEE